MQLRLKGGSALALGIAILGFAGWRTATARADLDTGAADELAVWIGAEHTRDQLRGIESADELTPAKVDSLLASGNVTFASIRARGAPDDMIVRAEVLIDGRPDRIRYYRMSHDPMSGWRVNGESSAVLYYLHLF